MKSIVKLMMVPIALSLEFSVCAMSSEQAQQHQRDALQVMENLQDMTKTVQIIAQGLKQLHGEVEALKKQRIQDGVVDTCDTRISEAKKLKNYQHMLQTEVKYTAVSAGCYASAFVGLILCLKGAELYHCNDFLREMLAFYGVPIAMLTGHKLTNLCHEYLDKDNKHKTANVLGFLTTYGLMPCVLEKLAKQ